MLFQKNKSMSFASGGTTLISKSTELVGDVRFSGNLEVEGKIRGNIFAEDGADARVRILDKGAIEGEIHVPTVVVNGSVSGNVYSSKHVELASKALVQGNVHYRVIEMVKGAQVNGNLIYSDPDKAESRGVVNNKSDSSIEEGLESGDLPCRVD